MKNFLQKNSTLTPCLKHAGAGSPLSRQFNLCLFWLCAFLLFACSSGEADYQQEFQAFLKTAADTKPVLSPFPKVLPVVAFHYNAYDKRDPFVSGKLSRVEKIERNREPLEAYPLDTLRMVGTLAKRGERRAIIKASSDGSIHTVRVGSYMGKNLGRVMSILDTEVRLVETILESDGSTRERPATIVLTTEEKQ